MMKQQIKKEEEKTGASSLVVPGAQEYFKGGQTRASSHSISFIHKYKKTGKR